MFFWKDGLRNKRDYQFSLCLHFLSSLWSALTTKSTLFLNQLSWQASLHGVPRLSKASQEQLAAYKPPGIFQCFHMFWKIKDAMSSVPASSWMTELVQRTVLLVEPKPYTELTTRKLTKVTRLCKAHCAAKNKFTWKIQTPEVKSDRCWEKTESNRRKKHWEFICCVFGVVPWGRHPQKVAMRIHSCMSQ